MGLTDRGPDPNQVLGRRAAAAHLALDFWSADGGVSTNSGDAQHGDENNGDNGDNGGDGNGGSGDSGDSGGDSGGDASPGAAEARGTLLFMLADNAALLEQEQEGQLLKAAPLPL
eukprot:scaffold94208_cov63-Phaeocystis_antarctica.AAC.3